jgi:hypothetical protein
MTLISVLLNKRTAAHKPMYLLLLLGFLLILVSYLSKYIQIFFGEFIPLLKGFSLERFFFFTVPVWVVLFGVIIKIFYDKMRKLAILICIIFVGLLVKGDDETTANWKQMAGHFKRTNYKAFYAEDLFREIDTYIGKPKESYKVVSVGIFPGVALFNGYHCLDAYMNTYPLKYKHEFRKIINKELEKNEELQKYFDYWGSRCYLFSSELGKNYEFSKKETKTINNLEIDTSLLKEMGCGYIFSALPILNYNDIHLEFMRDFEDKNGKWKIYLYKI